MTSILKISDAATLAMHATAYLAANPGRLIPINEIAETHNASINHLSKVMQRLAKAGLVKSIRGPKGGFRMVGDPADISLLQVFEAIEGPLCNDKCLLGMPVCNGGSCILGDLVEDTNDKFRKYMAATKLTELAGAYGGTK